MTLKQISDYMENNFTVTKAPEWCFYDGEYILIEDLVEKLEDTYED